MKTHKVFYGWWIVIATFPIAIYVAGAVFYGFTAIFEPIADEMGWSYAQVSFASSLRGLESGLLAPVIGILVDRWGPRRLLFIGALTVFAGLFLLSRMNSLVMFYGSWIIIAMGMSACTMTVLMTAIANWFRKKLGLASGLAVAGFGFGGLLIPLIVKMVEIYDWRTAVLMLSFGALFVVTPLSLLFRHKPEQYGYYPDGIKPVGIENKGETTITEGNEKSIGGKEALRSHVFWRLSMSFFCLTVMLSAVVTHVIPYLSSLDIDSTQSSMVATGVPLASAGGRFLFAWMGDRIERKKVLAITLVMMLVGLVCFELVDILGTVVLILYLVLFGVGYGGGIGLRPGLVREYFGRANFGTVFGLMMGMGALGTVAGPLIAGWIYDTWGSYQNTWFVFTVFAAVAVFLVFLLPSDKKRTK